MALEGHRFTPKEALDAGIVDYLVKDGTTEAVMVKAQQIAETVKGLPKLGVYGLIRVSHVLFAFDVLSAEGIADASVTCCLACFFFWT